jgi:hypothetical protein
VSSTRTLVILVAVCLPAASCRAPGTPPRHPTVGVYRDIIRREADSTHTALATARLLITTARIKGLPDTYVRVTLRGIVGDLQNVATDLHEITPPPRAGRPQQRLAQIAAGDARLLAQVEQRWSEADVRARSVQQVSRDIAELDTTLSKELQLE